MRARWLLIGVLLVDVLLAASPFIPITKPLWGLDRPEAFFGVFVAAVTIQVTLLTALAYVKLDEGDNSSRKQLTTLISRVEGASVTMLRDDDFYKDFLDAASRAHSAVRISYFAPTPPSASPDNGRTKYYDSILAAMKKNTSAKYKRLVRDTPANREWVAALVMACTNRSNISIALLAGDLPETAKMPLALSVQTVDDRQSWLVAVSSHEREDEYRDVGIWHKEFTDTMKAYFERLWGLSDIVLEGGVVVGKGRELVRASSDE